MRRLPIKTGYAGHGVILYYSGEYMIINNSYHLFFVADLRGVVYDTLLLENTSVSVTDTEVKTIKGEIFKRI